MLIARIQPPAAAHIPFAGPAFLGSFVGPTQAALSAHFTIEGEEAAVDAGDGGVAVVDTEGGVTGVDPRLGVVTAGEPCFRGPPRGYCFAGPPTAVCLVAPPTAVCAKAGLEKALPHTPNN